MTAHRVARTLSDSALVAELRLLADELDRRGVSAANPVDVADSSVLWDDVVNGARRYVEHLDKKFLYAPVVEVRVPPRLYDRLLAEAGRHHLAHVVLAVGPDGAASMVHPEWFIAHRGVIVVRDK